MSTPIEEPEDIPRLFVKYWNQRNTKGIAGLFAEDAEFVNVVGLWWHNRESIYRAHDYGLKKIFSQSILELRQTKIKWLVEEVAVVHARMKLSHQTGLRSIKHAGSRQNIFTFVLQRKAQSWICVAAHNTDIIPGKETNIVDKSGIIKAVDYRDPTGGQK